MRPTEDPPENGMVSASSTPNATPSVASPNSSAASTSAPSLGPRPASLGARVSPASQRILSGPLALEIARFGVPLALGMGLQTSFNLVDAYIISGLGGHTASAALGAIGVADLIGALGTILSYGLSIATGAIISRKQGEGDMEGVRRVAWQSVLLLIAVSALTSAVGLFGAHGLMVGLAGAKGEVARVGTEFLRVMMGGSFTIFLLLHLITIQRALGSSKTPIVLLVVANLANLVLAVLFVYGPGPAPAPFGWGPPIAETLGIPRMELVGAAWATVIARCFGLVPIFYIAFRRFGLFARQDRCSPNLAQMRRIWEIGWPTSSQLVVRVLAIFVVVAVAQRLYTTADDQSMSTALGLVLRLETMALYVGLGWGSAAQTFVGQNLGAVQSARAKQSGWYATLYNAIMMAAFAAACSLWGKQFVMLFDSTPQVVDAAIEYLGIVAPGYVGLGIGIVLGSAIQGAGATRQSLRLDTLVICLVQVPLCVAAYALRWQPTSLWAAVCATYFAFALTYIVSYRQGAFLKYNIE
jgi:MATE family, multidrug efflux pump